MTRYLIDPNIVSETAKPHIAPPLADWLAQQSDDDLFIATLTLAELWRGVQELPVGRRRAELEQWFSSRNGPQGFFRSRILPFDEKSALVWGGIVAQGRRAGRPRSPLDMIIAAVAATNECVVVTANERHFEGAVEWVNPLRRAG